MKKYILFILLLGVLVWACSMQPAIVRTIFPVIEQNNNVSTNYAMTNQMTVEQENIKMTLRYLNRRDLYYLSKRNKNPYENDGVSPILSVFKIIIKNNRPDKIKIDKDLIVLLDGMGHQYNALNAETYKQMYPATYERSSDYNFLFSQTFVEPKQYAPNYYKRNAMKENLFQGGYIYKNVEVIGILSFPRVSELIQQFTILIPDVELYDKHKLIKKIDFKFTFIQTIERIGH